MAAATYFDTVQKIYIAFYQRPADPAGLKYWAERIDVAGGNAAAVVSAFATSPEAVALYGTIDATTIGTVIDKIYLALFNKAPDAAGKQFYVDGFTAGTFTAGTIALNILNGAINDDAVAIANKLQVANDFTQQVDGRALTDAYFGTGSSFNATYAGDADAQAARDILKTVTSSPSTVLNPAQVTEQIKTKIADAGDPIQGQTGGQTFTLTVGADNFIGGAGNDTFNALTINSVTGADAQTMGSFDVLDGGAGTDTLNIYSKTGFANNSIGTVKNIEIVNIRNENAGVFGAVDASKFVGATQVWQFTNAGSVTGLAATTTAGFNGTAAAAALSAAPADAAATTSVAFANVGEGSTLNVVAGAAGVLNAVNVSGTVKDSDANGTVADTNLAVTVGKDVESLTVKTAVGTTLTVTDGAGTKKVSTVDASASTGAVTYVAATTVANVKTGTGKDVVTLATALDATTKAASLTSGDGDDDLTVTADAAAPVTGGTTAAVDAGAGNDKIAVTVSANTVYDVKAGAGDDTVTITNTIKTTDKIDGGDGKDTVSLTGKASYVADDYIVLNKVLTNFETLQLTGVAVTNLDASQLAASYTTIDLLAGSTVTKVGTQALVANGALTATATGTDTAATPKVYAGTLNITEKATGLITANADTVNLTVDASKGTVAATLAGFAKSANVTLVQALKADKSAFEGAASFSLTTAAGVDADMTSLKLSGNGAATVTNAVSTKLATVDASGLNSVTFDGKVANGLTYASANATVETITLGAGKDALTIGASTYGAADTITGLNLVLNAGKTALETTSDTLAVTGATGAVKFTTTQTDLDLALKDAAASVVGANVAVFQLGGNTYVYADKAGAGIVDVVDAGDILVKLTGTIDLDALVIALT